jgi:hypothetical protein
MPAITIKGLKGISSGMKELGSALSTSLFERTAMPIAQESRSRLEGDTPVITGRLLRSTTIRKGSNEITLGQFAPYANIVNNRRGFWSGAIQVAQKWPPFYARMVQQEIGVISRRYANQ